MNNLLAHAYSKSSDYGTPLLFRGLILILILNLLLILPGVLTTGAAPTDSKPNFLIIMADDCTFSDLPVYGGQNAKTPNIDQLASSGLTFNRAYLTTAMCQPCRAELYTGLFPMSNGCAWNHSKSRSDIKSAPHYLKPEGYRVGLAGKIHVGPKPVFPFEDVSGYDPNCVRNPTRVEDLTGIKGFMNAGDDQPFMLVVALVEPHVPWVMGDASQYPQEKIDLPPNIADTEGSREAFSRYLAEITYMDSQVGEILNTLESTGKASDTVVLFTSEQGSQFPGCKWTTWDTGLHTALIARWPGHIAPGTRTDAIVHYADVLPTLLDLAGVGDSMPVETFDGRSFRGVLEGTADSHRKYAYGMHNNVPEGPPYPSRSITDGSFRYIRNLTPDEMFIEKHLMGLKGEGTLNNPYWGTWVFESQENPDIYRLIKRYVMRPPEELYHTSSDPYELTNLIGIQKYQSVLENLRSQLDAWQTSQGDPGIEQDSMESLKAARNLKHRFGPGISVPSHR